ncbi:hypothetical protein B0A48_10152 [Cryoendolithus antarcticus]|uniref:prephenate dehydratase n=1 Tax=Cryoendolithus antarcticus TaxID=1507870 RepID=A0A1V8SWY3_9PEZI|nr:hypothetical protein B0A48_10152 [Cryoendolithus antarcticus]
MTKANGAQEKARQTVVFLGPVASYTHAAALQRFSKTGYELRPVTTIEDIFAAVADSTADRGVVPFENSTNGIVPATLDLFANASGKYGELEVIGEEYVAVNHCIVGLASGSIPHDAAKPNLSYITTLYSHPQAWGQCTKFLSANLAKAEHVDTSSTSRAAELVSVGKDPVIAAISSALAAKHYKLDVLADSIQNTSNNTTRFLIIRRNSTSSPGKPRSDAGSDNDGTGWKTLISFTVPHTTPGALADCLAVFKAHDLNLTGFHTRPFSSQVDGGEAAWRYIFFAEFGGRRGESSVDDAFQELLGVAESGRWLGSWEEGTAKG